MTPDTPHIRPAAGAANDPARALAAAAADSPYLAHLCLRRPDLVERMAGEPAATVIADAVLDMQSAGEARFDDAEAMRLMRRAKEAVHLCAAAADLSGGASVREVTSWLTGLADAAVEAALSGAARRLAAQGRFPSFDRAPPGVFMLAMGKMGAGDLNYSSDIDLIALFDADRIGLSGPVAKDAAVRLTREMVRRIEERTPDGYVMRTDLRLRPDPGSTAIAVSTAFALDYYASVGQNWERMAHIKARVCAGDREAGESYLGELEPYVWRRHLDYWAINDIHSIKRQIHSHGRHAPIGRGAFDVKLGVGGIREIEFFVQVQQLILGGRSPDLRCAATLDALAAFARAEVVTRDVEAKLRSAYVFLRGVEHRIQMINDEQTHLLPEAPDRRARVARLCGYGDVGEFEDVLARVRRAVHEIYSDLFAQEERLSGAEGNLVFTGVEDDPGTVETLRSMGFPDPSRVIATFQRWHRGGVRATRSARGRELLTTLGPRLLKAMSAAGDPGAAFERFSDFFAGLASGVQTMSMWLAHPELADDLIDTMAFAPRLAQDLARRPAILEAMVDPDFSLPVSRDPPGRRLAELQAAIARAPGFEAALNAARRFHREEAFRISHQLLRRIVSAADAGEAFADLADACIAALADLAAREVESRYGGPIGRWVVCGLGKLGGRELSASSDLDMMVIYDPLDGGGEGLASRFVQRLVAALTAPTEEGALYEVDMQLRPSGRAGPVAVKLGAFAGYYRQEAWTWEFMALTRLRVVAGDAGLAAEVEALRREALARKSTDPALRTDVLDMRRRLARERPAASNWDLKFVPGGIVDVEFVVQQAVLLAAGRAPDAAATGTLAALEALKSAGKLPAGDADALAAALVRQLDLQQVLRAAAGEGRDPRAFSPAQRSWIARLAGFECFDALEADLAARQTAAAAVRDRHLGALATE